LPHVTKAHAEVILSRFFPKSNSDVIGGDHKVFREAQGVALSTVEEDVGGDGGDGSSHELESGISKVPLEQGEQLLGAFEDGHVWPRERLGVVAPRLRSGVVVTLAFLEAISHTRYQRANGHRGACVVL